MGQKVNPIAFRLGIIKTWESQWFSDKKYSDFVLEDFQIRKFLKKRLYNANVSKIEIERSSKRIRIRIFAARPGMVIGRKGTEINSLKEELGKKTSSEILLDIQEVKKSELDAQLVAENIALQIERRAAFRRVMRKAISTAMRFGAEGIKVICSGRLAGAEMARSEWYKEGRIPLHTLRADINYGFAEANTTYGIIGIKVFVFEKEVFKKN